MPIGYLTAVALVTIGTLLAVRPLRRSGRLGILTWLLSAMVNESPFIGLYWILAVSLLAFAQGDLNSPVAWTAFVVGCASFATAPVLLRRSRRAAGALDAAFDGTLGADWRDVVGSLPAMPARQRLPWVRIALAPIPLSRRGVRRRANVSYGPHGRRNLLDVYRGRDQPARAPLLIHLHGGGFRSGRKSFYSRALLQEFARNGWVCVSASYRLHPRAVFHDFVIDVKRVIVWAREHALELGADPSCVVVAGSSAGAHLAVSAALTQNQPAFQPGFEGDDTSVSAAIGLYGYYGSVEPGPEPSAAADFAHRDAPPLLIVHGEQDTFVPPEGVRQTVARLRATSINPVVYAELPGAQHTFDLFHSVRFATVIHAVAQFTSWVRSNDEHRSRGASR